MKHKHNAGCGQVFCFHGAFGKKSEAVKKEDKTPGGFIKSLRYGPGDYRYAVLTRRTLPEGNPFSESKQRELDEARNKYNEAKRVWDSEKTWNKKKRKADDDMQLWGGKIAFLEAWRKHETSANPASLERARGRKNLVPLGEVIRDALVFTGVFKGVEALTRGAKRNAAPGVKLDSNTLSRRNMAFDWMVEHFEDYPSAQMLAQAASTKYDIAVEHLIAVARSLFQMKNPLFSRAEKRLLRTKLKKELRRLIFGERKKGDRKKKAGAQPRSAGAHRSTQRSGLRADVISALVNQGFSRKEAERMAPQPATGEDFTSLFRRAIKRNPDLTESERRALEFFRGFHGHDPKKVIKMEETVIESGDYSLVGKFFGYDLMQFETHPFKEVMPNMQAADGAGIKLAAGNIEKVDGRLVAHQLFVMGGNQNLEPVLEKVFGITSTAQLLDLGQIKNVWYIARKKQDNFQLLHYHHTFGEEGGDRPYLMYDRLHKKQFIVGGDYTVPLEGIKN